MMKRLLYSFVLFCTANLLYAQDFSVGINTETPNPNAVLELVSPNGAQGFLIPRLSTNQRTSMNLSAPDDNGLMVFDNEGGRLFVWFEGNWSPVQVGSGVIGSGSITNTEIAADAVDSRTIADGAIITVHLSDGSVTDAKIVDVDYGKLTNLPANLDDNDTDELLLDGTRAMNGNLDLNGNNINNGGTITAASFSGDGSALTNISAGTVASDGTTITGDGQVGTELTVNVGTGAGQILQFGTTNTLPALDGSALTNLPTTAVNSDGTTINGDGLVGTELSVNAGTGPNQIVQLDGTGALPALDGSALTNLPATAVASDGTTITGDGQVGTELTVNVGTGAGQVLQFGTANTLPALDGSALTNLPTTAVNSDGTTITGDGLVGTELSVNAGTGPNQIVQLDGTGALPALDGSALTNLPATAVASDGTTINGDGQVGTELAVNTGTGAGQILQFGTANTLPALDGNALTNLPTTAVNSDGTTITGDGLVGTELTVNTGTGVGQILQFGTANTLPALNGSALTNLPATAVNGDGTTITGDGLAGTELTVNTGTGANQIVQLDGASALPAVNGAALTGLTAAQVGDVGTGYTGTTIADNATLTAALQSLETAAEGGLTGTSTPTGGDVSGDFDTGLTVDQVGSQPASDVDVAVAYVEDVGTFTGSIINDNVDMPTALQELETAIESGNNSLGGLDDVNLTTQANGDILVYNGTGWGNVPQNTTFSDTEFLLENDTDNTKAATFDLAGITTGNTRAYQLPDADGVIALQSDIAAVPISEPNASSIIAGTGSGAGVTGTGNAVFGANAATTLTSGTENTLIGSNANVFAAPDAQTTAIGYNARTGANRTIAVGHTAQATANDAIAIGQGSQAGGAGTIVIGSGVTSTQTNTIVLGGNGYAVGIGESNPSVALDINATTAVQLPVGDNAGLPGTPEAGMIRYSTETGDVGFRGYDGSAWSSLTSSAWQGTTDVYVTGNVGARTTAAPRSPLEVDDRLSMFYFQNNAGNAINGSFVGANLYTVKGTDDVLRRMGTAPGAFMFLNDNGDITFLHATGGTADSDVDLNADITSSLVLRADGSIQPESDVDFRKGDHGLSIEDAGATDGEVGGNLILAAGQASNGQRGGNVILEPKGSADGDVLSFGYVEAKGTMGLILPIGGDADRPTDAAGGALPGMIRYNTDGDVYEGFIGGLDVWEPLGGSLLGLEDDIVFDGTAARNIVVDAAPTGDGQDLILFGGDGAETGTNVGGNIMLSPGVGKNGGDDGVVLVDGDFVFSEGNKILTIEDAAAGIGADLHIESGAPFPTSGDRGGNLILAAAPGDGSALSGDIRMLSQTALLLPKGNTAERDAMSPAPEGGMLRFNAETSVFEGYNGASWEDFNLGAGLDLTNLDTDLKFVNTSDRLIGINNSATGVGRTLTLESGSATNANNNGGNIVLRPGAGFGTGLAGLVEIDGGTLFQGDVVFEQGADHQVVVKNGGATGGALELKAGDGTTTGGDVRIVPGGGPTAGTVDVQGNMNVTGDFSVGGSNFSVSTGSISMNGNIVANAGSISASSFRISGTNVIDASSNLNNINNITASGRVQLNGQILTPPSTAQSGNVTFNPQAAGVGRIIPLDPGVDLTIQAGFEGQELIFVATTSDAQIQDSGIKWDEAGPVTFGGQGGTLHIVYVGGTWVEVSRSIFN